MKKLHSNCLAVFIKYPEMGKVKSRLAIDTGNQQAKDLYTCFVQDILEKYFNNNFDLIICLYPPDKLSETRLWLGEKYLYNIQNGETLGDKMKNTFIKLFDDYSNVIIIGSDSPDLPIEILDTGYGELDNTGSVIGPANDGGYYLIGFNKNNFLPEIFDGIQWSTANVFENTIKIFNNNNHPAYILPEWYDIDTIDDLKYLHQSNLNTIFKNSQTMKFIQNNFNF